MKILFYISIKKKIIKTIKNVFPECYLQHHFEAKRRSKLIIHENSILLTEESKEAMIMMRAELLKKNKKKYLNIE